MDDYAYYEDVEGLAPCEFCGRLIPLMDLILHETGHQADVDDIYEYPLFDDLIQPEILMPQVENLVLEESKPVEKKIQKSETIKQPKIAVEEKQTSSSNIKNETKVIIEEKFPSQTSVKNNKSEVETQQAKKVKLTTKNEEKLPKYDIHIDPVEDLEQDKEEFKMPNNPVLSTIYKEKDEEDINNLSDDDSNESLEEFWKRARDYLKRNRVKSEC